MTDNLNQIDLSLTRRQANYRIADRDMVNIHLTTSRDVLTTTGVDNLFQAIINRLFTRQGELAQLGHPDYGSRLHQLVGEPNNNRTRIRAEFYIRECLAQEPRIEEIRGISFIQSPMSRHDLTLTIAIKPVSLDQELTWTMSLNLEA